MDLFRLILAALPLTLFSLLLLFRHSTSILKISFQTLVITLIIAFFFWYSPVSVIFYSLGRGLLIALDILLIIFGAILFLEILKRNQVIDSLAYHLDNFSPDSRVQVIMLAWFLENFLEGIAGFGTPSTVVAPMLVALGISPFKAVIISLLGNSTSVPFGAVGTPIRIGFSGLNFDPISIATTTAAYNYVGLLVPVFMLWVLVSGHPHRWSLFRQGFPFALWSGIAFVLPAFIISLFGIEFPSIIGSILGIILVIFSSRLGLFIPKPIYHHNSSNLKPQKILNLKQTIFPYALFIFLLIMAKILFSHIAINLSLFSYSFSLFNPGFIFILTSVIIIFYSKINSSKIRSGTTIAANKSLEPFLVTAAMSAVVQLMNNTSMTQTFSVLFKTKLLPFLAPFIGAFGSFITGSATVSNIMFASSINSSAILMGLDSVKLLSLLLVGAGAGNMIAIADVLVAKTVANSGSALRTIIFSLAPYCLIYLFLVAIIGTF